jgi:hypothetical protein
MRKIIKQRNFGLMGNFFRENDTELVSHLLQTNAVRVFLIDINDKFPF